MTSSPPPLIAFPNSPFKQTAMMLMGLAHVYNEMKSTHTVSTDQELSDSQHIVYPLFKSKDGENIYLSKEDTSVYFADINQLHHPELQSASIIRSTNSFTSPCTPLVQNYHTFLQTQKEKEDSAVSASSSSTSKKKAPKEIHALSPPAVSLESQLPILFHLKASTETTRVTK